jgi:uncharacterized membrane protein YvlD (DUF360 family)
VAVPRTSVQPPSTEAPPVKEEGLSAQTLIIAALSSGIAAIVVSHFWERGTIFASAMTPVVVAIASELLRKPVQSERLRSGVRNVSSAARPASYSRPRSGRTPNVMAPPPPSVDEGLRQREEGVEPGPVRVYSSGSNKRPRSLNGKSPRRRLHLKVAVVTGLIAFLIAAAALTLPELIFGESVDGSGRNTTFFGGGKDTSKTDESKDDGSTDGQSGEPSDESQDSTSPSDSGDEPSQDSGSGEPESTTPAPAPQPESTTPAPAPQTPAPAPTPPAP